MNSIDNIFLPVVDMAGAVDYYGSVLGLELKFDFADKGMVAFRIGQDEPALILKDVSKFAGSKPAVWFVVDDVAAKYRELCAKGVHFLSEPFPIGTGMSAEFEDAYGNRLGITDYTAEKRQKE